MFSGPSRTANAFDTIAAAAFEAQYSARCTATATALAEVTLTMEWNRPAVTLAPQKPPGKGLRQKEHRLGVHRQAAIPARLGHVQQVAACQHPHARVVDQRGQRPERASTPRQRGVMARPGRSRRKRAAGPPAPSAATRATAAPFGIVDRQPLSATANPSRASASAAARPIPARRPGDQGDLPHPRAPFFISSRAMIIRWIWFVPS